MFGSRDADDLDMGRDMSEILKRAAVEPRLEVVQMRPAANHRPPLEHTAIWMRSLRYEDMMQMATEMHAIKAGDAIDTPEQLAKLLHSWAKATTEPSQGNGLTET